MDFLKDYKYMIIAFLIGILIGWFFFRSSGTQSQFVGLTPLLDTVSEHTRIFLDSRKDDIFSESSDESEEESEEEKEDDILPKRVKKKYVFSENKIVHPPSSRAKPPSPPKYRRSKGEEACLIAAEEIFGVPFRKVRPNWLINPKTGRRMEIDCYNDDIKVGIEYNGKQHYIYPNGFHKCEEEFEEQKERDISKLEQCDQNGVYLITVPYTIPPHQIKPFIEYYHPEKRAKRIECGDTGSPLSN